MRAAFRRVVGALLAVLLASCEASRDGAPAPGPSGRAAATAAAPRLEQEPSPSPPPLPAGARPSGDPFAAGLPPEVGSVWSNSGTVVAARAWVRPGFQPLAVAWNGLVYQAITTGEPADLRADVLAILERDAKERAGRTFFSFENDEKSLALRIALSRKRA